MNKLFIAALVFACSGLAQASDSGQIFRCYVKVGTQKEQITDVQLQADSATTLVLSQGLEVNLGTVGNNAVLDISETFQGRTVATTFIGQSRHVYINRMVLGSREENLLVSCTGK